jgi:hypothetical protein
VERRRYVGLWLLTVIAALTTGAYGGWMVEWVKGNTASVQVDPCYRYYGRLDASDPGHRRTQHLRCEGYWQGQRSEAEGGGRYLVGGPIVGVKIKPTPGLVNPQESDPLGYHISPDSYDRTAFAVLNGDAAVVVPTTHLVLGPLGLASLLACGLILILFHRRTGRPESAVVNSGTRVPGVSPV